MGRIIRVVPPDNQYGAGRTEDGYRVVQELYGGVRFSRRTSEGSGESGLGYAGTIGDPRFRFQANRYMPDITVDDEVVLLFGDRMEAYNIVLSHPVPKRAGLLGDEVGGYTQILAQLKPVQNPDMDIYQ